MAKKGNKNKNGKKYHAKVPR